MILASWLLAKWITKVHPIGLADWRLSDWRLSGYGAAMTTLATVRLMGTTEIAVLLGVSRARVKQLTAKPWFPRPVARLTMGGVWELADIERMATETGRTLNYDALAALSADPDSPSPGGSSSGTAGTAVQREP